MKKIGHVQPPIVGLFASSLLFAIARLYFAITTNQEPFVFVKAMINGYEDKKVG